ncbi:MAG TPA: hypothetical protein VFT13_09910 [Candidatus Krumholzibacteria bacterium]|nr:hypothetical protein [Candidatus Krumholzibacteria bacterium]
MLRSRAGAIAESIVRRAPAGAVTFIFVGGSVARGTVWAAGFDGSLEVYSDIDLYVVARSTADLPGVRAAAQAAVREPGTADPAVRYLRGVDAGVYTPADLRAQPARPGTADLAARHVVLFGDRGALPALLPPVPERIPPDEALRLLENRMWDAVASAGDDPGEGRLRRVLSLKLDLDIAAAHLIVAGATAADAAEPAAAIARGAPPGIDPGVAAAALRAARARDDLAPFLAGRPATEPESMAERVCAAWRELASRVLGMPDADAVTLVARRCNRGRRFANLREFIRVAGCVGVPTRRVLGAGPRCSERSARAALRVHPLARILAQGGGAAARDGHPAYVDRVTKALGFRSGTLDERVGTAHRAIS